MANVAVIKNLNYLLIYFSFRCLVLGRIANRLLHYFKECWSECQSITPLIDDDFNSQDNPLKKSSIITRDKNNNTKTRKNYRQLAGLSDDDDDDEPEYTPIPSSKRVYSFHRLINLLNKKFFFSRLVIQLLLFQSI